MSRKTVTFLSVIGLIIGLVIINNTTEQTLSEITTDKITEKHEAKEANNPFQTNNNLYSEPVEQSLIKGKSGIFQDRLEGLPYVTAYREVDITVSSFDKLRIGDTIKINYFEGAEVSGTVKSVKKDINGTLGLVLDVDGYDGAYTFISISDGKILANTHLPFDENYGIKT